MVDFSSSFRPGNKKERRVRIVWFYQPASPASIQVYRAQTETIIPPLTHSTKLCLSRGKGKATLWAWAHHIPIFPLIDHQQQRVVHTCECRKQCRPERRLLSGGLIIASGRVRCAQLAPPPRALAVNRNWLQTETWRDHQHLDTIVYFPLDRKRKGKEDCEKKGNKKSQARDGSVHVLVLFLRFFLSCGACGWFFSLCVCALSALLMRWPFLLLLPFTSFFSIDFLRYVRWLMSLAGSRQERMMDWEVVKRTEKA